MAAPEVPALLEAVYNPASPPDHKREAEARLNAFSKSFEGLQWALATIQRPCDPQQQFYAATVLDAAAARWDALGPAHQGPLLSCLWQGATAPPASFPPFVTAKLRAAAAAAVCADWRPALWDDLQACLAAEASAAAGVRLLGAIMDHIQASAQGTAAGLSGKVLSSRIPLMQSRLKECQPMALHLLCSLLEQLPPGGGGAGASIAGAALEALRGVLAGVPTLSAAHYGDTGARVARLLLPYLATAPTAAGDPSEQLTCAAMGCLEELLSRPQDPEAMIALLGQVLPALASTAQAWAHRAAATSGDAGDALAGLLGAFTRLLLQALQRGLPLGDTRPDVAAAVQATLAEFTALGCGAGNPVGLMAAAEAWHAVLTHLEDLEAASWGDDDGPSAPAPSSGAGYKQGALRLSALLLAPFFAELTPQGTAPLPPPPFRIDSLDAELGSGAALDDWVAAVGGDADGGAGDGWDGDRNGGWDDQDLGDDGLGMARLMGAQSGVGWAPPSESEVFAQHAESFLAHATSCYAADLVPVLLAQLEPAVGAAAAAAAQQGVSPSAARLALLRAEFALRLVARCAPHLPVTALTAAPGPLDAGITGAHALQLLRALLDFGAGWMQSLEAAAAGGRVDQAAGAAAVGAAACRTLSPLMTTWLPQVILTQAASDPETQGIVCEIVQQVLGVATAGLGAAAALAAAPQAAAAGKALGAAAAQTLLSLTSIALSSGMKPPEAVLRAAAESPAAGALAAAVAAAAQGASPLPPAVLRPLCVSLSDLTLRSWGASLQAGNVSTEERAAAFGAAMAPLLVALQPGSPRLRLAASLSADVVSSYTGAPKAVRAAAFAAFIQPSLAAAAPALQALASAGGAVHQEDSLAAAALLRHVAACLQAFPAELGTARIGELLDALVAAYSASSGAAATEAGFAADLGLLALVTGALGQGGSRHAGLVPAAMDFGQRLWERAAAAGATHVQAEVLAGMLNTCRSHWRALDGGDAGPAPPAAALLTHLAAFLADAAEVRAVPSAADVRLVLEELYDLQTTSKLFWRPWFGEGRQALADSLLLMLLSRVYTGAQDQLVDTLYSLASANWSAFWLSFLPAFVARRLGGLGPRGAEAAAALGVGDMDAATFERAVQAFVNDSVYWERAA